MAQFKAGQTGNRNGRPKGARNKSTLLLDSMASGDGPAVLQALLDKAKEGDVQAIGLILARIWPVPRGRYIQLDLPPIATASDVIAALSAVIAAVGRGELTSDEASGLAGLVEAARKSIELADLEARIIRLETGR